MSSYAFNPQLPPVPQGEWSDASYLADEARLRAETISKYHDVLQQLGYTDDQGNYIPGIVDVEANRRRGDLGRSIDQAALGITRNAQREGTLFSGIRADRTGEAEFPYRTELSQLEEDVPRQLSALYEQAGGLLSDYTLGRNQLIGQAAQRYTPPAIAAPAIEPVAAPPATLAPTPLRTAQPAPAKQKPYTGYNDPESGGIYWNDPDWRQGLPPSGIGAVRKMAEGGIVDEPTDATIGEAGPEAVVPLDQGLMQAIQRLIQMYQRGGGQGAEQASPTEQDQGQQGQKAPANVHATGLKAAAKILMELAKQHEEEQGNNAPPQATPMQPPPEAQPPPPTPEQMMLPPDASGLMGRS
jgi:hypothetical protein